MPINNGTILVGGTVSTTGGTSTAFVPNGAEVNGGIQVVDSTSTNAVTRASITFRTIKNAVLDMVTGLFTGKTKRQAQLVRPKVTASGRVVFPLVRIELETHPEMTDAEISALMSEGAQLLVDADFTQFWKIGSNA